MAARKTKKKVSKRPSPKARGAAALKRTAKSRTPRASAKRDAKATRRRPPAKAGSKQHHPHAVSNLALELDGLAHVRGLIRDIPNFPQPGVLFRDITPLLADPRAFHIVLDALAERFVGEHIDAVVGIESRGFIFGGALAARLNASFVPVRKPGKLPYRTEKVSYSLEYGESELEMHRDSLREGARVLIVDDLLATGGTAAAAAELVDRQGGVVAAFAFVIELDALGGRNRLDSAPIISILNY
ncbi:MAG: adenine phosphoribosyltransferase [Polyangiaceae bacterium]